MLERTLGDHWERGGFEMKRKQQHIVMEDVTDAGEIARAQTQRKSFDRNVVWLQGHISEVYSQHRGKCICIAGEELFVGDSAEDVIALARAAHPEDSGWFTRYIPKEKVAQIYVLQR